MKRFLDLLKNWLRPRHVNWRFLPLCMLMVISITPVAKASVADIISLLRTITSTIQNSIGSVLNEINTIESEANNFRQRIIYPVDVINAAKAFVLTTEGRYRGLFFQVRTLPLNSASLVNPAQFEATLRGAGGGAMATLQSQYKQIYMQVPAPTAASAQQRDMMDMADASSLAALKSAVIGDQASGRMLSFADTLTAETGISAPGSAPMLALEAQIANLQNQAYLAKMLAADLRAEATNLAHRNALLKQSAANTRNLWLQMQQVVSHP